MTEYDADLISIMKLVPPGRRESVKSALVRWHDHRLKSAQIEEVNLYADWMTDNNPAQFMQYAHDRTDQIEAGDAK